MQPFFYYRMLTQNYQHILALVFAIKEINENSQILPNVSLGFSIYNNYFSPRLIYHALLEIVSTWGRFVPNYKCDAQNNLVSFIGGPNTGIYLHMTTVLRNYKIPQVNWTHGDWAF